MRNILATILFSFFSLMTFAQLSIETPDLVINGVSTDEELYGYTNMTNQTSDSLHLRWVRRDMDIPVSWQNYFCAFPGECGLPWTDSLTFSVAPASTSELQCHCLPNGEAYTTTMLVDIKDDETGAVIATIDVTCDAAFVNTNELETANIRLYPNPVDNEFKLENADNVDEILIYNILGRQVRYFARQSDNYYIGDLAKGIYLVQLRDIDTNATKTLKLQKN